jgi:hypothetical protein
MGKGVIMNNLPTTGEFDTIIKISMKITKGIIIGVVFIIVLIAIAGMYKFNYLANQSGYDVDGNKIESTIH